MPSSSNMNSNDTRFNYTLRGEEGDESTITTHPQRKWIHTQVMTISFCTISSLILMGCGQMIGLVLETKVIGPIQFVLRLYLMVFCILGIFIEFEWTSLVVQSAVLRNWITRGFFYIFVAILGLQENDSASIRNVAHWGDSILLNYIRIVSWFIMGVGCVYFIMGILCFQFIYEQQRDEHERKMEFTSTLREYEQSHHKKKTKQHVNPKQ